MTESDSQCIFCQIVSGTEPAEIVWSDDDSIAFLDTSPASAGHVLVVPKSHFPTIWDVPAASLTSLALGTQKVAIKLKRASLASAVNIVHSSGVAAWQDVAHFHYHVIPRSAGDSLIRPWSAERASDIELHKVAETVRDA
jgi:histidine triad (HIT) family protein